MSEVTIRVSELEEWRGRIVMLESEVKRLASAGEPLINI